MPSMNSLASMRPAVTNTLQDVLFAGPNAKTADHAALERAQMLEELGASPDEVWQQTGWGRGADSNWRFEIDDSQAGLRRPIIEGDNATRSLDHMFDHPELLAAYPDLAEANVTMMPGMPKGNAAYLPLGAGQIVMGTGYSDKPRANSLPTMLHELQHGIQKREGFGYGTSPGATAPGLVDEEMARLTSAERGSANARGIAAWRGYARNQGETEARNVEARRGMSPEERRMTPPWATEDFPRHRQVR